MRTSFLLLLTSLLFSTSAYSEDEALKQALEKAYASFQTHLKQQQFQKAAEYAKKALDLGEELHGEDDVNTAILTLNYATILDRYQTFLNPSRFNQANGLSVARQAVRRYERIYGGDAPEMLAPLTTLARALARTLRGQDTRTHNASVTEIRATLDRAERIAVTTGETELLADFYLDASRLGTKESRKWAEKAYSMFLELYGPDHLKTAPAKVHVAAYRKPKKQAEMYKEAITTLSKHPRTELLRIQLHQKLSLYYDEKNKPTKVTEHLQAAGALSLPYKDGEYLPVIKVAPSYPRGALQRRVEGYVILEFMVTENGTVKDIVVIESKPGDVA